MDGAPKDVRVNKDEPTHGEEATFWLRRCHGFRVDSAEGRVGIVEDVLYGVEHDRASALVVRTGLLRQRREVVPVEEVDGIDPRLERVILRARPGRRT